MRRCRTSPEQLRQLVVNLAVEMQGAFSNESLSAAEAEERVMELMRDAGREALGRAFLRSMTQQVVAPVPVCSEVPCETAREMLGRLTGIEISDSHA